MARIKFSSLITDIKGKLGNVVFQGSKSGTIIREHVIPRNVNSPLQKHKRGILQVVQSEWQALTTTQKNSWIALSSFVNKKQRNNQNKSISAYELFIQSNFLHIQSEISSISLTTLEIDTIKQWYTEVDTLSSTLFKMYLETSSTNNTVNSSLYISKAFKSSSSIPKSSVRYVGSIYTSYETLDITEKYLELFGVLPVSGQKVLTKRIAFLDLSGWVSKEYYEEITI